VNETDQTSPQAVLIAGILKGIGLLAYRGFRAGGNLQAMG